MTIEPGYYWIRRPKYKPYNDRPEDDERKWHPCFVYKTLKGWRYQTIGDECGRCLIEAKAELGPRIEPPDTK